MSQREIRATAPAGEGEGNASGRRAPAEGHPQTGRLRRRARQNAWLVSTIAWVSAIWVGSDLGYYLVLPRLGVDPNYNASPIVITAYYCFWIGVTIIALWPTYRLWARVSRWPTFQSRMESLLVWTLAFIASVAFVAYGVPALPELAWDGSWAPEFVRAGPLYFLPKSADILLQQLLVLAFVVALAAQQLSTLRMSLLSAALFGGAHVLLFFGDVPLRYVVRFMISAAAFGLVFPYLILRVRHGLAYSYMVHWAYYAFSVVLPHIVLAVAPS
ncbi:MAG: hypothetical protein U1E56_06855 [Bauldia sp.]